MPQQGPGAAGRRPGRPAHDGAVAGAHAAGASTPPPGRVARDGRPALDLRTTLGRGAHRSATSCGSHGPEAVELPAGPAQPGRRGAGGRASRAVAAPAAHGKVDAWLRVTRTGRRRRACSTSTPGFGEAVLARLRRFQLRTKAELEPATWSGLALRGPGAADVDVPTGAVGLAAGWPGVEGVDLLGPGEAGARRRPARRAAAALEALRIECGVPAMGAELTEATIPAEAGQWLIDASVSFTKGCYTGQELVARIDSRGGNVPRPSAGCCVDGEPPCASGPPSSVDGAEVGTVTSVGAVAGARTDRAGGRRPRSVELGHGGRRRGRCRRSTATTVAELPLR